MVAIHRDELESLGVDVLPIALDPARHAVVERRVSPFVGATCLAALLGAAWPAGAVACTVYSYNGQNYYFVADAAHAEDYSGSSSSPGTEADTTTPSQWSATNPVGSSNEAVWLGEKNNPSASSIEGGFITGALANGSWTNSLVPYWTIKNGQDETDLTGNPLPASTALFMYVQSAYTYSGGSHQPSQLIISYPNHELEYPVAGGGYAVASPRQNFMQGETHSCYGQDDQTWMGNGNSPESFDLFYESGSQTGVFFYWGFQNPNPVSVHYAYPGDPGTQTSLDPEYQYSTSGAYTFSNWGK
jgi:hypothetical protein